MSIDEVALVLHISERSVYRLISRSQLMSLKVGHRTLVEPAEVRNFIASQRQACKEPRRERAA
jgi:excisionase family DNA binding protein